MENRKEFNYVNECSMSTLPEVVGTSNTDAAAQRYEVERLINTLAAIIQKYAGQLDKGAGGTIGASCHDNTAGKAR